MDNSLLNTINLGIIRFNYNIKEYKIEYDQYKKILFLYINYLINNSYYPFITEKDIVLQILYKKSNKNLYNQLIEYYFINNNNYYDNDKTIIDNLNKFKINFYKLIRYN